MTFARLTRGDWLAAVAALALLLVMALDWYTTEGAQDAIRAAEQTDTSGAQSGEPGRQAREDAEIIRNRSEKNAWQAEPFADRVVLLALLAAVILALAAAWLRAANKRFDPPWTPSTLATGAGLAAAVLLAARIIQKPSAEPGAVVKLGAPLGLVCVGILAVGARLAWNAERDGSAFTERSAGETAPDDDEATAEPARPARLFDHDDGAPATGATATIAPPAPAATEEAPAEWTPPPPEQERLAPAVEPDPATAWAPDWDDPAAAERERRRIERDQHRSGGRTDGKRRRFRF